MRLSGLKLSALATAAVILVSGTGRAETLRLQGSSTFNRHILEKHRVAIERSSGQILNIVPNRTVLGLQALAEGRADIAMISAPLANELLSMAPATRLAAEKFQVHPIAVTRVAIGVHRSNPVHSATLKQITSVVRGETTNWAQLGGNDAPIRVVVVGKGGGVTTTLEAVLLGGERIAAKDVLKVTTAVQLAWVVEQDPNTLAFGQLSLLKQRGVPEITTDEPIEQPLALVTMGPPTSAMAAVIAASRDAAALDL
ncbi:MAG: phosphate transporter substrate-binding protein [Hyphomicrobiales bacterium]|nr:phosphate transporter substrate-binding protein [Hyphomicrobiales bacterium]